MVTKSVGSAHSFKPAASLANGTVACKRPDCDPISRATFQLAYSLFSNKNTMPFNDEQLTAYERLHASCGSTDLSDWSKIRFTGEDRQTFLHNMCTANIKALVAGSGCELFVTNVQGKTVGYGYVIAMDDALLLLTAPGQAELLIAHFERYVIRERLTIEDVTSDLQCWLVGGAESADAFQETFDVSPPSDNLKHVAALADGENIIIVRSSIISPDNFLLLFDRHLTRPMSGPVVPTEVFHAARIEAGTPLFGIDITSDNLPQEVDRDDLAISFNKGCYIGQETVARLDALGHANWLLRRVQLPADHQMQPGDELKDDDRTVCRLGSIAWSPKHDSHLALGYVCRGSESVGSVVQTTSGNITIA